GLTFGGPPAARAAEAGETAIVALAPKADAQENRAAISLQIGQQYVLSADGVRSYSEGTRGIVDVRLTRSGDQFVLVGEEEGSTTLLLIMLDGSERHFTILVGEPQRKEEARSQEVRREDNIRLD